MLARKMQQCCRCQVLMMQYPTTRLLHQTHSVSAAEKNASWVREASPLKFHLENKPVPTIKGPNDVLIKVEAASVNPFDVRMSGGYGDRLLTLKKKMSTDGMFSLLRGLKPEDRIQVLGRDFSGVVEAVGDKVEGFKAGDEVFGATAPMGDGSHAQYTLATDKDISKKPSNLNHIEASCIPYVALTFLAGFHSSGATSKNMNGKRVHLNAAAGGVGCFATQYLKAIGCEVAVSVGKSAMELVTTFNPDHILDYQAPDYKDQLKKIEGFDIVYDLAGDESALPAIKSGGCFLTTVHPMISTMDEKGLILGAISTSSIQRKKQSEVKSKYGADYKWVYFGANRSALEEVKDMIEGGKIKPIIAKVFPFEETPAAYELVAKGLGGGKVIIDVAGLK